MTAADPTPATGRCGECRLGLGTHTPTDPHCAHHQTPTVAALVALSQWIDAGNAFRDAEAVTWGRLAKLTEESGEVIAAFIGATGQNPRKGITHSIADVGAELLDVAVTALGAYEHLTYHQGLALPALEQKILAVAERAGLVGARLDLTQDVTPVAHTGNDEYDDRLERLGLS